MSERGQCTHASQKHHTQELVNTGLRRKTPCGVTYGEYVAMYSFDGSSLKELDIDILYKYITAREVNIRQLLHALCALYTIDIF